MEPPKKITISASQIETFDIEAGGCERKWWLQKVAHLPQKQRGNLVYGSCLHACIERFLLADDQGADRETGLPVDLFPPGWEIDPDGPRGPGSGAKLSLAEQDQIRRLIAEAISAGVLERRPGRRVEWKFLYPVTDRVDVTGFMDVSYLGVNGELCEVEDHKSSKNKKYLKSPAALAKNNQMLLYGNVLLKELEALNNPLPDSVVLRHNGYTKTEETVRKTEVSITRERLLEYWKRMEKMAERMANYTENAKQWFDLPEPPNPDEACNKYGGCDFFEICAGRESPEHYTKRLTPLTVGKTDPSLLVPERTPTKMALSLSEVRAKIAAAKGNSPAAAAPAPPTQPIPPGAPPTQPGAPPTQPISPEAPPTPTSIILSVASKKAGHTIPPWANPSVKVNGGIGFTSEGKVCRICEELFKQAGEMPEDAAIEDFIDLTVNGDGTVRWRVSESAVAAGAMPNTGTTPLSLDWGPKVVKAESKSALFGKSKSPVEIAAAPVADPEPVYEVAPEAPAPEAPKRVRRTKEQMMADAAAASSAAELAAPAELPTASAASAPEAPAPSSDGFTLYFGCVPVGRDVVLLSSMFADIIKDKDYYSLDAFRRRDAIAGEIALIAASIPTGAHVVVDCNSPDTRALSDGLRPIAKLVVVGLPA